MHVALHAAKHGRHEPKPMEDLARALDMSPFETWEAAAVLAAQLEATAAFATGLCVLPAGEVIAERLNLDRRAPVRTVLAATTPPALALGFEELRLTPGLGAKVRFVACKLFPSRTYMRFLLPLARRGPLGLLMAYCWRLIWLAFRVGPGFRAWMQVRRNVR
jgi:hypothetical protein